MDDRPLPIYGDGLNVRDGTFLGLVTERFDTCVGPDIVADRRLCEETSARLARNRLPPWSAESYSNRDSRNTLDMRDRLLWLLLSLERPLGVP